MSHAQGSRCQEGFALAVVGVVERGMRSKPKSRRCRPSPHRSGAFLGNPLDSVVHGRVCRLRASLRGSREPMQLVIVVDWKKIELTGSKILCYRDVQKTKLETA